MINILKINRNLNETQKLVIDSVKSFCKSELKPVSYTHLTLPTIVEV